MDMTIVAGQKYSWSPQKRVVFASQRESVDAEVQAWWERETTEATPLPRAY